MSFKKIWAGRPRIEYDYSPLSWTNFFDEAIDVKLNCNRDSFRVYLKNFQPPYSPERELGTHLINQEELHDDRKIDLQTPTLVLLHGGGYSALTWSTFVKNISESCIIRCLAIDLRGHGDTLTSDDDNLNIETLVNDVINVTRETHTACGFTDLPRIVLIGHSMGGAIAVKCSSLSETLMPSLVGFVVIDVVEGTAKEALPIMVSVIESRPKKFSKLSDAIEWSLKTGMTKNIVSARVSMPGNLVNMITRNLAIHDFDSDANHNLAKHKFDIQLQKIETGNRLQFIKPPLPPRLMSIRQQECGMLPPKLPTIHDMNESEIESKRCKIIEARDQDDESLQSSEVIRKTKNLNDLDYYIWRTNLGDTESFWSGWFDGLSEAMLSAPVQGKFLLLAGMDRLDRTLTIGQMQGKFMMKVLPKCGHAVHEDEPEKVSEVIADFLVRNKFVVKC